MSRFPWTTCTTAVAALLGAGSLAAQRVSPEAAVGVAVPTGDYGAARGTGPAAGASVLIGGPGRRVRLRVGVDAAWFPGPDQPPAPGGSSAYGDLRALGAWVAVLAGPRGGSVRPYALAGIGGQRLRVPGRVNPYGTSPAVRAGVGLRAVAGGVAVRAEVAPTLVLSDFATGRDFGIGSYWPVTLGISF